MLRGAPHLGFALGPALAGAGPDLDKRHLQCLRLPARSCIHCGICSMFRDPTMEKKWARTAVQETAILPITAEETLKQCDKDVYSIVHALLKVLLTLPVSVASAERSFSCLRWLKTWLKNNIGEERLNEFGVTAPASGHFS